MISNKSLERIVARMGELPAMPAVVSEVLKLTEDPKVDMQDVSQVIEADPALAAKILQVSNSSYYGMKQFVGTLKLALVILGVREVRNVVLGISVFETLKDKKIDLEIVQNVWDGSLELGAIAKRLAAHLRTPSQGEEFVAGLLSNVGKIVLLRELGADYKKLYVQASGDPDRLCLGELEEMGYTHADASTALAVQWSLPKSICDAIWAQYPNPERSLQQASDPLLASLLRIARHAHSDLVAPLAAPRALSDEEPWQVLAEHYAPVPAAERAQVVATALEDSRGAAPLPV